MGTNTDWSVGSCTTKRPSAALATLERSIGADITGSISTLKEFRRLINSKRKVIKVAAAAAAIALCCTYGVCDGGRPIARQDDKNTRLAQHANGRTLDAVNVVAAGVEAIGAGGA